jgi:hypothetical protein
MRLIGTLGYSVRDVLSFSIISMFINIFETEIFKNLALRKMIRFFVTPTIDTSTNDTTGLSL